MTEFTVLIPGQAPSTNHMYARSRYGKTYKAAGVESYQTIAAALVRVAKPTGWTPTRRVHVEYQMWMDGPRRDASNCIKALEDAIAIALGVNDLIFLPCVTLKEVDKQDPRVIVTIRCEDG